MLEFGDLQMPYLDSSEAPDIGGQALAQAQRLELVSGAGPALPADDAAKTALVTNGDAFDGLLAVQKDTHELWLRTASAWLWGVVPYFVMSRAANQALTTSVSATIDLDTTLVSTLRGFTESGGTVTCSVAGTYRIDFRVTYAANATGSRVARLLKNGAVIQETLIPGQAGTIDASPNDFAVLALAAADTIAVQGFQSSGGNLNAKATLSITRLA